ncbi:MAG TPA: AgmX/PglI C-terminal domain-containing protein [Myxococcota bacterium]|nr:AgmX/PglI C-terminal domain-containing protein [Myxococcota bacterium]
MKIPLTFSIYKGDQLLRTERIEQDIIKIGKLQSSHLRIDDENVSRMHSVIEVTAPDQIYIIDLGSTKGTIVNGQKINKCKLQSGDEILLGDTRVVVQIEAPSEAAVAAAPAAAAAGSGGVPAVPAPPVPMAPPPVSYAAPAPAASAAPSYAAPAARVSAGDWGGEGPATESENTALPRGVEVIAMWDGTVQHVKYLRDPAQQYLIGEDIGVDWNVPLSEIPAPKWPLVAGNKGGEFFVSFTDRAVGEVVSGAEVKTLAELRQAGRASGAPHGGFMFAMPAGARASITFGDQQFLVSSTYQPVKVGTGGSRDWKQHMFNAVSLGAHLLVLLLMFSIPPDAHSLSLDSFNADNRFVKYIMKPPEKPEDKIPSWLKSKKKSLDDAGGKGKRHKGEEGKMGSKTSKNPTGLYGLKGPPDNKDIHLAKRLADEAVKSAGFLGIFKEATGSHLASEFGRDTALGTDEVNALGGLMGDKIGEAAGEGGLGLYGTGRGGGGTGEGTIGLDYGGPDTIGKGGGGGSGSGYGKGAGSWGGHKSTAPDVVAGAPIIRGSLDKEIIRRVIRKHKNEIKYCYEKELTKKPDLHGKVKISFVIAPTGAVAKANSTESTLGNPAVDACVVDKVLRFIFPKPEGGGIVEVSYPFVFNAGSGGKADDAAGGDGAD